MPPVRTLYLGLVSAFAMQVAVSATPEVEQLRAELEAMKAAYARQAEQMRALEERIRALETPAASPPATAVVEKEYQRDTESRDQALLTAGHPYAGRVQEVLQGFMDIHGYFRAGYGRNDSGGSMVGFQAPGASAKYRLGNEPDSYGEITFGKNFYGEGAFGIGDAGGEVSAADGRSADFKLPWPPIHRSRTRSVQAARTSASPRSGARWAMSFLPSLR